MAETKSKQSDTDRPRDEHGRFTDNDQGSSKSSSGSRSKSGKESTSRSSGTQGGTSKSK